VKPGDGHVKKASTLKGLNVNSLKKEPKKGHVKKASTLKGLNVNNPVIKYI